MAACKWGINMNRVNPNYLPLEEPKEYDLVLDQYLKRIYFKDANKKRKKKK
jgi:hypothetical protein